MSHGRIIQSAVGGCHLNVQTVLFTTVIYATYTYVNPVIIQVQNWKLQLIGPLPKGVAQTTPPPPNPTFTWGRGTDPPPLLFFVDLILLCCEHTYNRILIFRPPTPTSCIFKGKNLLSLHIWTDRSCLYHWQEKFTVSDRNQTIML